MIYKIKLGSHTISSPELRDKGFNIESATLTMGVNSAGSLTFKIPKSHPYYDRIFKMRSYISVFRDDKLIFTGRVLHDTQDFYGNKEIYCEGLLSLLLDSIRGPYELTTTPGALFWVLGQNHNEAMYDNNNPHNVYQGVPKDGWYMPSWAKQFTFTFDESFNKEQVSFSQKGYVSIWDEIQYQLLDVYGGHLTLSYPYNDCEKEKVLHWGPVNEKNIATEEIIYGQNLIDFSYDSTAENMCNVLIAIGGNDANGEQLKLPAIYDAESILNYSRIWKIYNWDSVTNETQLRNLANAYLQKMRKPSFTMTVRAVDMALIKKNSKFLEVGQYVRIRSLPHDLYSDKFILESVTYDLNDPSNDEYTFGNTFSELTDQGAMATKHTLGGLYNSANKLDSQYSMGVKAITNEQIDRILDSFGSFKIGGAVENG